MNDACEGKVLKLSEAQTMYDQRQFGVGCIRRHPGGLAARSRTCAHDGGRFLSMALLSDTLSNLRAGLPGGVSRRCELFFSMPSGPSDAIELWD